MRTSAPRSDRDTQSLGTFLERNYEFVGDKHELFSTSDYHENWGNRHEKWLLGKKDRWYYITPSGDLMYYQYAGAATGSPDWSVEAAQVGHGWKFKQVFAGANGAIYAIKTNGDMYFYKHDGVSDGSAAWSVEGAKIGHGWNFKQVFADLWDLGRFTDCPSCADARRDRLVRMNLAQRIAPPIPCDRCGGGAA